MAQSIKFTPAQQSAIDVKDKNILVSAAAGSGKTAVLSERVIRLISMDNPVAANELLVVTFTVAAANEMRQRIEKKLEDFILQNPENETLLTQQMLLQNAKISTIHSLCSDIVKDNFHTLGLSAHCRLADETEIKNLIFQKLEEVIESFYKSEDKDFYELVEWLAKGNDSLLYDIAYKMYSYVRNYPFYDDMLCGFEHFYDDCEGFLSSPWKDILYPYLLDNIRQTEKKLENIMPYIYEDPALANGYGDPVENDLLTVTIIRQSLENTDWDSAVSAAKSYERLRLRPVKGAMNPALQDYVKNERKNATDKLIKLISDYFITDDEQFKEDIKRLKTPVKTLVSIVRSLDKSVIAEKRQRDIMDFSDLEHFTLNLLVEKKDSKYIKTPLAKTLSNSFYEIMIDECQDINNIQNLIFWALSKSSDSVFVNTDEILSDSKNLFMVGDVKQSVYSFRNAVPKLFVKRKEIFNHLSRAKNKTCAKIILRENFRSRDTVTSAVNEIFRQIMSSDLGEITYDKEEKLVPSAQYPEYAKSIAEFHLLDSKKNDDDEEENTSEAEAEYVASLIKNMVDKGYKVTDNGNLRRCRYKDFCILLRSQKTKAQRYIDALKKYGIDCYSKETGGYLKSPEISALIDMLRILDNPLLDISLFAVMTSPIFMFTYDEIAKIRINSKDSSLYVALTLSDMPKVKSFLKTYNALRADAVVMPLQKLIQSIFDTTDFLNVVQSMPSGDKKSANLKLFLSYAESYAKTGNDGLDGFLRYLDKAIERDDDLKGVNTVSDRADIVSIMTIHASKGLEFPICIVADMGKRFNLKDSEKGYMIDDKYGFAMKISEPENLKEYTNLPYMALKFNTKLKSLSEEMRVLYVALTRAKEKLIMVAKYKNAHSTVSRIVNNEVSFNELVSRNSFGEWVISALRNNQYFYDAFEKCYMTVPKRRRKIPIKCVYADGDFEVLIKKEKKEFSQNPDEEIINTIKDNINFKYRYSPLTKLPAKVTATKLAKADLSGEANIIKPLTIQKGNEITGALKGTVLHSFMQYADFKNAKEDLSLEIQRLVEEGFLSKHEIELLNKKSIEKFLSSKLLERMLTAKNLYREYPFIYYIKAGEVDASLDKDFAEEKILLQGIADAVIEEQDHIVIVDYKTDRVENEAELVNRYYNQLKIYKNALADYFNKPVKECIIYSLYLSKAIEVDV